MFGMKHHFTQGKNVQERESSDCRTVIMIIIMIIGDELLYVDGISIINVPIGSSFLVSDASATGRAGQTILGPKYNKQHDNDQVDHDFAASDRPDTPSSR